MRHQLLIFLTCLFTLNTLPLFAQQKLKFQVASFKQDPLDLSARSEEHKKLDSSGSLYAIVKVKSDSENDALNSYIFDFGLMRSMVEEHDDLQEIWIYVQKNAKRVTIKREGYVTVSNYDLKTTIEAGGTYRMMLSVSTPVVYNQMVMFRVQPITSKAFIMVKGEQNVQEEVFGQIDETGAVAKGLPFGTYSYRVAAENYYSSEGSFTLNNQTENHVEDVVLRANFATVTLNVDADADIYVDGERRGTRSWTGALKAGSHQVECRQDKHRSTTHNIIVSENESPTISLTPPTPITGILAITSNPLGASLEIDGKNYGQTPKNVTNLLIGQHSVQLIRKNNKSKAQVVEIFENQTTNLQVDLTKPDNLTAINVDQEKETNTAIKEDPTIIPAIRRKKLTPWTIRFGVGLSALVGGEVPDGFDNSNLLVGKWGVEYSTDFLFQNFCLIPSLDVIIKGGRQKYTDSNTSYGLTFNYNAEYKIYFVNTQISMLGAYYIHPSWRIKAGPYISYALDGKLMEDYSAECPEAQYSDSDSQSWDVFEDGSTYKRFDAGLVIGLDYLALRHWAFGLEYQRGFVQLYDNDNAPYHSAFYASIGYRF